MKSLGVPQPFFLIPLVIAVSAISPTRARADIMPGPGDCEGKSEGASCVDEEQKAGACGTITSTRTFTRPIPGAQPQTFTRSYFGCRNGVAPTQAPAATASTAVAPENTDSIPTKNNDAPAKKVSPGFCGVGDVGARSEGGAALVAILLTAVAFIRRGS